MKIILGIDFGLKKIGIARSDLLGITPRPLFAIPREKFDEKIEEIKKEGWEITSFVIGYPLNVDGSPGEIILKVEEFVKSHLIKYALPIYGVDERYSSIEAEEFLKKWPQIRKRHDDNSIAAVVILKRFLSSDKKYILKKWN